MPSNEAEVTKLREEVKALEHANEGLRNQVTRLRVRLRPVDGGRLDTLLFNLAPQLGLDDRGRGTLRREVSKLFDEE